MQSWATSCLPADLYYLPWSNANTECYSNSDFNGLTGLSTGHNTINEPNYYNRQFRFV